MKCRIFVKAETESMGCTEMLSEEIIENVTYSQNSGEFTVIDNEKIDKVVDMLDIEDGIVNIVFEKEFERIKFNDCDICKFVLSNTNGNKNMTLGFTADERVDEDICDEKMLTTNCYKDDECVSVSSDFPEEDENPKCNCCCDKDCRVNECCDYVYEGASSDHIQYGRPYVTLPSCYDVYDADINALGYDNINKTLSIRIFESSRKTLLNFVGKAPRAEEISVTYFDNNGDFLYKKVYSVTKVKNVIEDNIYRNDLQINRCDKRTYLVEFEVGSEYYSDEE